MFSAGDDKYWSMSVSPRCMPRWVVTMTTSLSRMIFFGRLALVMDNLCTKFEVSIYTHYEDMKEGAKCRKWSGAYDFLLNFNRNYLSILYHFRDITSYLPKVASFNLPHLGRISQRSLVSEYSVGYCAVLLCDLNKSYV